MTTKDQNSLERDMPIDIGLCALPDWGLIFVEGSDAVSFLQNQLTNSVLGLNKTIPPEMARTPSSVRLAGYCSPKGRLLASAWLTLAPRDSSSEDRFALFISKDIAASTAKRLSMYVLRSKVKVIDVSNDWSVLGFCSTDNQLNPLTLEDSQIGLQLPDVRVHDQVYGRALIAQPNSTDPKVIQNEIFETWNDLEVLSAIPRIVQATQEQFVPQMINFESVAGVDFKKGCYPGQEIVARSQYRGVIKRRLRLAHVSRDQLNGASFNPGVEIFHGDDASQPAGIVVLSAQSVFDPSRIDLQIECKLEALKHGEIRLGSIDGPVLKMDPLPYPLIEI
ncbi:folate-binding protein YgfZ [Polynucleobacter sp. MWH-UH25E]|uniref:CAF17-like 4Fe-4S cluster assembly/insertion protein YgfZ n=1 Tax=Polynucleobacter sp. MWH-UH25E TaxID=1855616 RepID=UPI001BFDCD86|nr:folate-binding protein [Polynucleobacter sp. MWH-UH25E]QWD61685.1 folate-binding protein YgfZ [Polynucleobacter sp. MWH-UH25E]